MALAVYLDEDTKLRVESDEDCEDAQALMLMRSMRAQERGDIETAHQYQVNAEMFGCQWRAHQQCRLLPAYSENEVKQ